MFPAEPRAELCDVLVIVRSKTNDYDDDDEWGIEGVKTELEMIVV